MRVSHQVRGDLGDPDSANLAFLGSVVTVLGPLLLRIARFRKPLFIALNRNANLYELREILCGRPTGGVRAVSPHAKRIDSCTARRRAGWAHEAIDWFCLGFAEVG